MRACLLKIKSIFGFSRGVARRLFSAARQHTSNELLEEEGGGCVLCVFHNFHFFFYAIQPQPTEDVVVGCESNSPCVAAVSHNN